MLEQTKRISLRISSVLSKVEPEPDLHTGSDSATLINRTVTREQYRMPFFKHKLGSGTGRYYIGTGTGTVFPTAG